MTNPEQFGQGNDNSDAEFPPALPPEGNSPERMLSTGNPEFTRPADEWNDAIDRDFEAQLSAAAIPDEVWFVGRKELSNRHQNRDS